MRLAPPRVHVALWLFGLVLFVVVKAPAAPAPGEDPPPAARTLIDDFEGDVAGRWRSLVAERNLVKQGNASARWAGNLGDVYTARIAHRWDLFEEPRLDFWCHSAAATGARFRVVITSDNPDTPEPDGYSLPVEVDWKGWKALRLPLAGFTQWGKPAGLAKVDALGFTFSGAGALRRPGTELCLDDLWLCEGKAPDDAVFVAPGEFTEVWVQSPEFNATKWPGLKADTDHVREGEESARWSGLATTQWLVAAGLPNDWSPYTDLEFWLYSEGARGLALNFLAVSDSPASRESDDHNLSFVVTWEGWRHVRLPFWRFNLYGQPVGWHRIDRLLIGNQCAMGGYVPETLKPDGFVCLDGIRLSKGEGGLSLGFEGMGPERAPSWQPAAAGAATDPLVLRLPFRQTNLGVRPVAFAFELLGDPRALQHLGIEENARQSPALPALVSWPGGVTATVRREALERPRAFFRDVQVITAPARGPLAPTAASFPLEPLYYRCLELLQLPAPETLVVEDFEEGAHAWMSLMPDVEPVHGGKGSARWENLGQRHQVLCEAIPHDWSRYNAVSFWMHANAPTGQPFHFIAFSNNPDTEGHDYYCRRGLRVDWTGWKQIVLTFDKMDTTRAPRGWAQIERMGFLSRWFTSEIIEGTVLHLDDIELIRQ